MGVFKFCFLQLASVNDVISHGGLPVLWSETMGASSGKYITSCAQRGAHLCAAASVDGRDLAELFCGGPIRRAPAPSRIGRMGVGAQRCSQRLFRPLGAYLLRPVCGQTIHHSFYFSNKGLELSACLVLP